MEKSSNFVQIRIAGFLNIKQKTEVSVMVMSEVGGNRKMSILIDKEKADYISLTLKNGAFRYPLVCDVMSEMVSAFGYVLRKVEISPFEDFEHVFSACMYFNKIEQTSDGHSAPFESLSGKLDLEEYVEIESRDSDAIALAVKCGCPIFVNEKLLDRCHQDYIRLAESVLDSKTVLCLQNLECISEERLKEFLQDALEREDYETAIKIREKLKRMQ